MDYNCAVCGKSVTETDNNDGLAAEAEEMLARSALGGPLGATCTECRLDLLDVSKVTED